MEIGTPDHGWLRPVHQAASLGPKVYLSCEPKLSGWLQIHPTTVYNHFPSQNQTIPNQPKLHLVGIKAFIHPITSSKYGFKVFPALLDGIVK